MQDFRADNLAFAAAMTGPEVVILGGGVNGVATLRDLALNGVSCALIDAEDFCMGATSASSRMAHGGLRYLEGREFRLVAESARERNLLIAHAPHLVRPLEITVPLRHLVSGFARSIGRFMGLTRQGGPLSYVALEGALRVYEALGRRTHPLPSHRTVLRRSAFPKGLGRDTRAVVSYYDGQIIQPEGLVFEMLGEALATGNACALNHVQWMREGDAIAVADPIGGERMTLRPRVIVNATGAAIDLVNADLGARTSYLRGIKGAHLVLHHSGLHARMDGRAYYFDDGTGRMVITLPVGDNVLVGTTEVETTSPEDRGIADAEITYLMGAINALFDDITITREHIVALTTGIRPLRRGDGGASVTSAARDHALEEDRISGLTPPVLSLVGGKWTTFRAFGEETADRVLTLLGRRRETSTRDRAYPGAAPIVPADLASLGIAPDLGARLIDRYGALARDVARYCDGEGANALVDAPQFCRGEVVYAIHARGALQVEDIVLRRLRLTYGAGLSARTLSDIAEILRRETGRNAAEIRAECDAALCDPRIIGLRPWPIEGAA
ncbi:glycerol-3-phosphate dehydrogenase/oxidase [Rhodovulum sp. FJ3]|uniref:glycerol-3-phosphate dehydrogenase/oxidase n=1 Tax=Rhodovulum sp. FJ3 TaxID=3079053 RepID=UPI00293DF25E|nr:glycerol-3-phosphate dehydrogenase/oxidase [Rhodovulum sp. FJ3]MDV4169589.1 glycerol-3-phosphate dehydrogenase/oxidase [Rhodovulum sp. FJ3]